MNGSLEVSEYPGDMVRLSCAKCGRSGQYRKQNLIERYGADMRLPDLREEIANCDRIGPDARCLYGSIFRSGAAIDRDKENGPQRGRNVTGQERDSGIQTALP
jgi:hypothetical protein